MKELNNALEKITKAEYDINALEYVLTSLELACIEEEQLESSYIVNVVKRNLYALKEDIRSAVAGLDLYIAENEE